MKTIIFSMRSYWVCVVTAFAFCVNGLSQISTDPGVPALKVGIVAVDSTASEPGDDTGAIKIYRIGDLTQPLTVNYTISGTAINGVDYRQIPQSVTIPAGKDSVIIEIVPIDDQIVEPTETVVLSLYQSPNYIFDVNPDGIMMYRAIVNIKDNDGNNPPKVAIQQPKNGDVFELPTKITLVAEATDEDGFVQKVGFFANGTLLGYVYNDNTHSQNLFTFNWSNPFAGEVRIKARAIDNSGAESDSAEIVITIKQQVTERDVVSVYTIDGEAEEIPPVPPGMGMPQRINYGIIRFWRNGPTNFPLYVTYSVSGTAENGVDYEKLPGSIIIPEGERSADLEIIPIYDEIKEDTETVVVKIEPPVCPAIYPPPPDCYIVGQPSEAVVKILDSQTTTTNNPPSVAITNPKDNTVFAAPANIVLTAEATDSDGYVKTIEFWANDVCLVTLTNYPGSMRPAFPYYWVWRNVSAGEYTLTAKAKDNRDAETVSAPVKIVVKEPVAQIPVVTITATDREAAEMPAVGDAFNPGVFTVRRTGPLDSPLTVYYKLSGTAQNGVDYEKLDGKVEIPAGMAYAEIKVVPIDDNLAEGTETVVATLIVPEVVITIYPPPPPPYIVGEPKSATVYIRDNEPDQQNKPPFVKIVKPEDGMTFVAPANIGICAEAYDPDGYITKIEYYEGERKIGEVIPQFINSAGNRYCFVWREVGVGSYTLTAVAIDNRGSSTRSAPVSVKVIEGPAGTIPIVNIDVIDGFAAESPTTPVVTYTTMSGSTPGTYEVKTERLPAINTATFVIRRTGPTNEDLNVHYSIGGTAINGVDYMKLPGIAVIPKGERSVNIVVVPIDDSIPEPRESVVLTLIPPPLTTTDNSQQSSNTPSNPPYIIGQRSRACAVIADNDSPLPPIRLPDGSFHILRPATNGLAYVIEVSNDLINWTPVYSNVVTEGLINYADADSVDYGFRFYRIRTVPTVEDLKTIYGVTTDSDGNLIMPATP